MSKNLSLVLVLVLVSGAPAVAQEPAAQERKEHVVKHGDTLWDLARAYLSNPFLWPSIYEVNKGVVENPHLIFPDEKLLIPPVAPAAPVAQQPAAAPAAPAAAAAPAPVAMYEEPARTRFYNPAGGDRLKSSGPLGPMKPVQRGEFYAAAWLADTASLAVVGRIEQVGDSKVIDQKLPQTLHPYDRVYLSYTGERPAPGTRWLVASAGKRVDPYGRVIEPSAIVRVSSVEGGTITATVTEQFGRGQQGDLLLPLPEFPEDAAATDAIPIQGGPAGRIIAFMMEQPLYGTTEQGFVDLGAAQGIEVGDELIAYLPERSVSGTAAQRLPAEPVALLKVIRVTERASTLRVVRVTRAELKPGLPVYVVAKMP